MKKHSYWVLLAILVVALNGCTGVYQDNDESLLPEFVQVGDKCVSVEDINNGIRTVFINAMYYHTNGQFDPFLNKTMEYELFLDQSTDSVPFPRIYLIITNIEHPLSNEEFLKRYRFGVLLTEHGLQSDFYEQSVIHDRADWASTFPEQISYLGQYTMQITEILPPAHEVMSSQWKQNAEAAIRLYMDENDFYSVEDENLPAGKYSVYVRGFSESDINSTIIFEHENGQIYAGQFYFVHNVSGDSSADLNHVELVENVDADYAEYLNRLKQHAALQISYSVSKPG